MLDIPQFTFLLKYNNAMWSLQLLYRKYLRVGLNIRLNQK